MAVGTLIYVNGRQDGVVDDPLKRPNGKAAADGQAAAPASEDDATGPSVRALDRALDLLNVLGRADYPMGLTEVSRAAGLHMTTTQRLLAVLERHKFVQRERGFYQLGIALLPLARSFLSTNSLTKSALPIMEELVATTGETVSLYVRQGFERVIIQRVETPSQLRFAVRVGERFPLAIGASGQILAAGMSDNELRLFFDQVGEARLASGQILTKDEMRARIERVRSTGIAYGRDERNMGVTSVGAPVQQPDGSTIAAIVVNGPTSRLTEDRIGPVSIEVRRAAFEISSRYRSF